MLLRGGPGVGKTTLVQNLGHRALERGYTVRFCTLASAFADLLRQESIPRPSVGCAATSRPTCSSSTSSCRSAATRPASIS
ncbi:ATP-binding protein [Sandaracinus amylolyticus]|uniref:ATP-binding protein n=1 Tax=Sandaracinus TaxID=1055688 RepID=UPI003AF3627A